MSNVFYIPPDNPYKRLEKSWVVKEGKLSLFFYTSDYNMEPEPLMWNLIFYPEYREGIAAYQELLDEKGYEILNHFFRTRLFNYQSTDNITELYNACMRTYYPKLLKRHEEYHSET